MELTVGVLESLKKIVMTIEMQRLCTAFLRMKYYLHGKKGMSVGPT
jgi:hypothetical protein